MRAVLALEKVSVFFVIPTKLALKIVLPGTVANHPSKQGDLVQNQRKQLYFLPDPTILCFVFCVLFRIYPSCVGQHPIHFCLQFSFACFCACVREASVLSNSRNSERVVLPKFCAEFQNPSICVPYLSITTRINYCFSSFFSRPASADER